MIQIAVISDTQYGSRQDYVPFLELNRKFFRNVFFPELEKRDIKVIVHLGDLLERRKYVNYLTASYLKEDFFDRIIQGGYHLHWIFGNHDIFYRETTEINAANVLAPPHIYKYHKATDVVFDGLPVLFIPWVVKENFDYTMQVIEQSPAQVAFGHLQLQGFQMDQHNIAKVGLSPSILEKFELVLTGHFHHRSIKKDIYYVGSHAEFTWADYGDQHGFHIFDTDHVDVEFVPNPYTIFKKVEFDGKHLLLNPEECRGKLVKVVVQKKDNMEAYNNFIQQIEAAQPLDISIIDTYLNVHLTDENIISDAKETLTIILECTEAADVQVNKPRLKSFMTDLYRQAQDVD